MKIEMEYLIKLIFIYMITSSIAQNLFSQQLLTVKIAIFSNKELPKIFSKKGKKIDVIIVIQKILIKTFYLS